MKVVILITSVSLHIMVVCYPRKIHELNGYTSEKYQCRSQMGHLPDLKMMETCFKGVIRVID